MRTRIILAVLAIALSVGIGGCKSKGEIVTPESEAPRGALQGGIHRVDASGNDHREVDIAPVTPGQRRMALD